MIEHVEIWKLAVDGGLVCSLVYLGFAFIRSQRAPRYLKDVGSLEASLRGLIKEAELAGSTLNDQLLRRQTSLERLLQQAANIEETIVAGTRSHDLVGSAGMAAAAQPRRSESIRADSLRTESVVKSARERILQDAPLHQEARLRQDASPAEAPRQHAQRSYAAQRNVNIYGEPVGGANEGAAPSIITPSIPASRQDLTRSLSSTSLASMVEREVTPPQLTPQRPAPSSEASGMKKLQEIYDAAEEMLKAGRNLEYVAARTNLPIDDIRRLSQMIIQERFAAAESAAEPVVKTRPAESLEAEPMTADSRLGVLGGMKRQVQTV